MNILKKYFFEEIPKTTLSARLLMLYLAFWAKFVINRRKPLIIGITGTAGKTTTKHMLSHVLSQKSARPYIGIVGNTRASRNDKFGLPLTILRERIFPSNRKNRLALFFKIPLRAVQQAFFSEYPKILVLEYGYGFHTPIQDLVKVARPHISILTVIGPAHLDKHNTVEGVYLGKRPLIQATPSDGLVILGAGHEYVSRLQADVKAPTIVVKGRGPELAENITRVVCNRLNLPFEIIETGLITHKPLKGRLNIFNVKGIKIIDDCYNANPLSMKLGLDTLAQNGGLNNRLVAVLGTMAELGKLSSQYHKEIGQYAHSRADLIIGVGKEATDYSPNCWFKDSAECAEKIESMLKQGDVILVKGSHSANMVLIVNKLKSL